MKIQIFSDLHHEFAPSDVTVHQDAELVIMAGDINTKTNGIDWVNNFAPDIPIIYICGNHEFYGTSHPRNIGKLKSLAAPNVFVLENESIQINDITFIAATLWANNREEYGMNDYKKIRSSLGYGKFKIRHTLALHAQSRLFIELALKKAQKSVVITHHAPSLKSLEDHNESGAAYATDLESLIIDCGPKLWVHGHIHKSNDYQIGATRVLSNPKGYPEEENPNFNPNLIICL